jgi:hypothetical protein
MTNNRYILKDREPIPCLDLMEWATWMIEPNIRVAYDTFGQITISTVFLGTDHSCGYHQQSQEQPILFETMVFPIKLSQRYYTYQEALDGHAQIIRQYQMP